MRTFGRVGRHIRASSIRLALILGVVLSLVGSGTQAQSNAGRPPFRYGIVVSDTKYYPEVTKMGFGYVKLFLSWKGIEATKGQFGNFPDQDISNAHANNLQVVALVFDPPDWASGTSNNPNDPPPTADNVAEFGNFMGVVAAHFQGQIAAYEIWNEENVSDTWGGQNPDPARYVSMLQAAYPKIKASDPNALVISGGVANTGDGNGGSAIGDLDYLRAILKGGALGNVDAIGIHPYPGSCAPEATSCSAVPGTYFQRAVEEHNVVAEFAPNLPLWITEAGYLSHPGAIDPTAANCNGTNGLGGFTRYEVDEATKANYLVDAYQYAYNNWPWLGMFMLMNLDLSMDGWRAACDPVRFWAILTAPNGRTGSIGESQAYTALKNMTKYAPQVTINPPPTGGYPQTDGTVTITGRISDPSIATPLTTDQITVTVDTLSGPTSSLATISFGSDGTFQIIVDVRSLSAFTTHSVYLSVHTSQDGWLTGSTGVAVVPLIRADVSSLTFQGGPKAGPPSAQVVNFLRNDGSSDPFGWSPPVVSPPASWLRISPENGGTAARFSVSASGSQPFYQTTVTIACTDLPCTSSPPYFANKITIPVLLVNVDLPFHSLLPGITK